MRIEKKVRGKEKNQWRVKTSKPKEASNEKRDFEGRRETEQKVVRQGR